MVGSYIRFCKRGIRDKNNATLLCTTAMSQDEAQQYDTWKFCESIQGTVKPVAHFTSRSLYPFAYQVVDVL
jgi:hypothetical protein